MSSVSRLDRFVSRPNHTSAIRTRELRRCATRGLFSRDNVARYMRLAVEPLEERRVLSGDQWVMVFRGLTLGATPEEQVQAGQAFLVDHGINDIQIVSALDLEGTFLIETSGETSDESLQGELQPLPGFAIAEEYLPQAAPSGTFDSGPFDFLPGSSDADVAAPASWSTATTAPASLGTMMLLSDGTVMAQGSGTSNTWFKLTANASGSYLNGSWSQLASMATQRLYYGSNVLPSGKVFLVGGEYSGSSGAQNFTNTGEIYDPVANTWSPIANFPQTAFGDDPTELLPDGRVLAGYISNAQTYIYNPTNNTWAATGTKLRSDRSDEETWILLPDGSILSYDIFSSISLGVGHAQRYVPSSGTWVDAGTVPVPLSSSALGSELGPALLLPDGRVFLVGANNNTALYTPSTNTWTAGPTLPAGLGADDAPGAVLPNGHVIFAADTSQPLFTGPTRLFDFDPNTNTITEVTGLPAQLTSDLNHAAFTTRMLVLPSGQLLLNPGGSSRLWVYTPDGSPSAAWRPTISSVVNNGNGTYTLTGTQLNGISEGASYGDDAEMSSNYPIVQLTSASTGNVYYARTSNWSSTGVATGNAPVSTQFVLPAGLPAGSFSLSVIANGIASAPVSFTSGLYWDPDGNPANNNISTGAGLGGSGNWNTSSAFWFNGTTDVAWSNANNEAAIFTGAAGTVSLTTGITARAVEFSTSGYTVQSNTLTLSGGNITVDAAQTDTVAAAIAGAAGLTLTGGGTSILTGANTYTGVTTISAGTLQVGNGGTLGNVSSSTITDNGALVFNRSDAVTLGSTISGTGTLTQAGTGTLIFTANNTYSGTTTINAGTLQLGNNGLTGAVASGAIVNNASLVINRSAALTLASLISGPGSLTKQGSSVTTLTAANTYTGPTLITGGTIQAGIANAIPIASAVTVPVGGNLNLNNFDDTIASLAGGGTVNSTTVTARGSGYTSAPTVIFNNAGTGGSGATANALLTPAVTGTTIVNGGSGYTSPPIVTFSPPPSGTTATGTAVVTNGVVTSITITNGGTGYSTTPTITFSGGGGSGAAATAIVTQVVNSLSITNGGSGYITIPTISFSGGGGSGAAATAVISVPSLVLGSGTLTVGGDNTSTGFAGVISGTGGLNKVGSGTLTLTGNSSFTGTTRIDGGTLQVGNNSGIGTLGSGPIIDNTALVVSRSSGYTISGAISGNGTFTKLGTGTTTLSGANSYSGTTTINAGRLNITGSNTSTATVVNSGGTLGGNGPIDAVTVNSGGTLSPGQSPGIISTGNLNLSAGSTYSVELNGSAPGTGYDQTNVTGTVTLAGALSLSGNRTNNDGQVLTIINNDGNDPVVGTFTGLPEGAGVTVNGVLYGISYHGGDGNDVTLTDDAPPRVIATSIVPGSIVSGSITIQVTFSEPMKVTNLTSDDYSLRAVYRGTNFGATASFNADGTVLTLVYGGVPDDSYVFTLNSGSANFASAAGTTLDGEFSGTFPSGDGVAGGNFVMTFISDVASEGFSTPLEAEPPIGSLVYDPLLTRVIAYSGDTDTYTINVDSGQTMSVVVSQVSGGLQPSVELRDAASNLLSSATSTDPNLPAFINSIPVAAGTQRITVSGVGSTTGRYNIQVILNAAVETESDGGASNDVLTDAQDVDVTAMNLGFKTSRLAALGTAGGKPSVLMEDFESGVLPASITTFSSDAFGNVRVAPTIGNGNTSGFALLMDRDATTPAASTLNEAIYTVDLSGATQATLNFSHVSFADETQTLPQSFTNHFNGDGVSISSDGTHWWTVLNAPTNNNWASSSIDLAAAAAAAGMTLGPNFQIKFQQYDDNPIPSDGRGFDNIQVIASMADPADYYKFTLPAGENATLGVTGTAIGNLNLDVFDGNGNLLATGSGGSTTLTKMISNFVDATGGTFYVRVSGDPNVPYNLVITRNAVLESEGNDSFATAQPMDGNAGALGAIYSGVNPSSLASTEGNSSSNMPFNIGAANTMRYQQLYSRTDFSQPGDITAVRFRRNGGQPNFDVSGINIKVNMAYTTSFASPSSTFDNNVGSNVTTVYDSDVNGLLTISSDDGVATPSPFDVVITFSRPFHYDPRQGDLLLDIFLRAGFTSVPFDTSTAGQETSVKRVFSATSSTGVGASSGTVTTDTGLVTRFDMNVPKEDWYSFNISSTSNILWLSTSTPDDGSNQFVNVLNPKIELYDPSGNLVATGKPNGLNNRNEFIQYQPSVTGSYRVRVTGENGTSGEYLLFKNFRPAPSVAVTSPINENDAATLTGTINDPDAIDSHTVVITWGNNEGTTTLNIPAGVNTFSASHTYLDDNPSGTPADDYPISVVVSDNLGGPGNAAITAGAAIALTDLHGDVSDTDFDTAVTNVFGPISASYLTFSTTGIGHSHGGPVDISVEAHDPSNDSWTPVFQQHLDNGDQLSFNGLQIFFPTQMVDQLRLSATPSINQAFHSWATVVIAIGSAYPVVTVDNVAPSNVDLTLSSPAINENDSVSLSGTFDDPGTLDTHTVTIDWGDGSASTVLNLDAGVVSIPATSHQYLDDNPTGTPSDDYTITVTVADDDGGSGSGSTVVTVNNLAPANLSVDLSADAVDENGGTTLTGSFTDAGTLDSHTVVINWGPGEANTTISLAAGVLTFSAAHQYLDDNPSGTASDVYPISVVVTDDDGGTETGSTSVTVNNVAPKDLSINLSASSINENDSTTVSGSFTDPGTLDTHTVVIDWGAGEGSSTLTLAAGVLTFSASHQYLDDNPTGTASDTYTVHVTVTDDDGGDGSSSDQTGSGLMQLKLQTTDLLGNPITTIAPGGDFLLQGTVRDLRPGSAAQGVFASYADVTYDPSLVAAAGPITYGSAYPNSQSGDVSTPGLIDEVGAFDGIHPLGAGELLLFSVPFHASVSGTVHFTLDPADAGISHATLLFGLNQPIPTSQIAYVNAALQVGAPAGASTTVTVHNVAPSNLALSSDVINENGLATITGTFDDPGSQDIHTVTIDWGEGSPEVQTLPVGSRGFTFSHQYLDDSPSGTSSDVYPVHVAVTDDDTGSASASTTVIVNNVAPSITASASALAINETDSITVSGVITDPGTLDSHMVVIDWGDGSAETTLTLAAGTLSYSASHQYLDDNPSGTSSDVYLVSVTVSDDDLGSGSASTSVTVNNLPPNATANSYTTPQALAVTGNVITDNTGGGVDSDPAGTVRDPLTILTYTSPANGTLTLAPNGSFVYTPSSTFSGTDSFTYTITDDDRGTATATVTIVVSAAIPGSIITVPDSCLGGTALLITGTAASDTIVVEPGSSSATLKVTFNGVQTIVARPSGRIIVTGGAGDDNIQIAGAVANPAWIYGDAGDDRLNAGNGGSLLIGGDGNDQLQGGGGRDVMIGGEGADHLVGNSDDDILIAGLTDKDSRTSANHDEFWCELLHEWNSADSFSQRVQSLRPILLPVVHDDHYVDAVDFLNGASGNDWLIFITGEDQAVGQAEATN